MHVPTQNHWTLQPFSTRHFCRVAPQINNSQGYDIFNLWYFPFVKSRLFLLFVSRFYSLFRFTTRAFYLLPFFFFYFTADAYMPFTRHTNEIKKKKQTTYGLVHLLCIWFIRIFFRCSDEFQFFFCGVAWNISRSERQKLNAQEQESLTKDSNAL